MMKTNTITKTDDSTIKKLSGATRGMRFMQRKAVASSTEEGETSSTTFPQQDSNHTKSLGPTSMDIHAPIVATKEDMYGISAKLIGRRSFHKFNKAVEDSWLVAYNAAKQEIAHGKVEKEHISDEELLKRYERYVKGKGDMVDMKSRAVGAMDKKLKKRKRNATDPSVEE